MNKDVWDDPILILHKYYITANLMRTQFDEQLDDKDKEKVEEKGINSLKPDLINLLCLWYGCLYVVIEGWQELRLENVEVDDLLKSDNVHFLKGCRNDTFHFQKKYYPTRFLKFISKPETAKWMRDLNAYFGKYFLEEFEERSKHRNKFSK